jgi:multiple sugar transport system substrate-binding protein
MRQRHGRLKAPAGRRINRRDFLKMGGAGLAGAALLGTAGCGGGGAASAGEVLLSMGPDDTGTLPDLIDRFNKQHKGEFQVTYREMPSDTGQYYDKLQTEMQAGGGQIDVIGGDVIWTAQLAAPGWIVDFADYFPKSDWNKFLNGPMDSLTYDDTVWGMPWYTDAGMLYYRKDILDDAGVSPPKTWGELKEMAPQLAEESGLKYGFVFQGSEYEGGVCNGLEYIWTHGGDVVDPNDPNKVVADSPETIAGLETMQSMVKSGASPLAVSTYTEEETDPAFLGDQAVFARNWPYMYALAADPAISKIDPEQIAVAPLPLGDPNLPLVCCLGGWNLLINAASDVQEESWEFIKFLDSEKSMKYRAVEATLLPTRKSLYDDPEVVEGIPVIELGKEAIFTTKPRPVSPYYLDMSLVMAEQFAGVVKGDIAPDAAAKTLQTELQKIAEQAEQA